jgi:hypothetical protein
MHLGHTIVIQACPVLRALALPSLSSLHELARVRYSMISLPWPRRWVRVTTHVRCAHLQRSGKEIEGADDPSFLT